MPDRAHISFIVAIEVAIPAWGLLIIDEAIAAPPTDVLAAGVGDIAAGNLAACDMALEVALTICTIVEEVDVVLLVMPFIPGMMATSMVVIIPFNSLKWRSFSNSQQLSQHKSSYR